MLEKLAIVRTCYALSQRQAELLAALVETGAVPDAAARLGISYVSARNVLAELKAKLGVETVPMMIGLALDLMPGHGEGAAASLRRHDLFNLTDRQYAIARAIGVTKSRREIAVALRVSESVVDVELKEIYLVLGVSSAGELVRLLGSDQNAGHDGSAAIGHDLPTTTIISEGRAVAFSDYGPAQGVPVLILHSTITARAPPTRLVAALRDAGYRPLAIDRPGFGGTDMATGNDRDPYVAAAHDVSAVCAALGLARINLIAREAAMRLAQLYPALLGRVVLVNPTPAIDFTSIDRGPLGAVKRLFGRRPWAVEVVIRMLAATITPQRMRDGMLRSYRDSAPDLALVRDDPQFVADYVRATHGFVEGKLAGYVAEQSTWGAGYDVTALPDMHDWRIVQARHFILHEPGQAMTYWRQKLPDTPVTWVEEAGQMLAYSHPRFVVAALGNEKAAIAIHSGMEWRGDPGNIAGTALGT